MIILNWLSFLCLFPNPFFFYFVMSFPRCPQFHDNSFLFFLAVVLKTIDLLINIKYTVFSTKEVLLFYMCFCFFLQIIFRVGNLSRNFISHFDPRKRQRPSCVPKMRSPIDQVNSVVIRSHGGLQPIWPPAWRAFHF